MKKLTVHVNGSGTAPFQVVGYASLFWQHPTWAPKDLKGTEEKYVNDILNDINDLCKYMATVVGGGTEYLFNSKTPKKISYILK